jgi:hypothetical protein
MAHNEHHLARTSIKSEREENLAFEKIATLIGSIRR